LISVTFDFFDVPGAAGLAAGCATASAADPRRAIATAVLPSRRAKRPPGTVPGEAPLAPRRWFGGFAEVQSDALRSRIGIIEEA
jgi:hypothetical protein